jgi:transposase
MLAKIRRMYFREKVSIREIAKRCSLSRNTVRQWLREPDMTEPKYPDRPSTSVVDPYLDRLRQWVQADSHRAKRDWRTAKVMFEAIKALGYTGSYVRVAVRVRKLRTELSDAPGRSAFVPLTFAHGEAFQFDWSCEYVWIGGLRRRLEVAHCKLASSRAFWLVAYFTQSHEMLFDAHTRSFTAFGGIPRRGIYDNMKTAVDKVLKGKVVGHPALRITAFQVPEGVFTRVAMRFPVLSYFGQCTETVPSHTIKSKKDLDFHLSP